MRYFDFEKSAREVNIPPAKMEELRRLVRQEFPRDEMMYELHLLRACMAIKGGVVSVEEAVNLKSASKS